MTLSDVHVPEFEPEPNDEAVVRGPDYRFTVLTPRVVRLEYDPDGEFEDRPSQRIWYRDQPVPEFDVEEGSGRVRIATDELAVEYDIGAGGFTEESLSIELRDGGERWQYGDEAADLGGALRTVDAVKGATDLGEGLVSREGWAVLEDDSLVFDDDGWLEERGRADGYEDRYFFGYGDDYRAVLRDLTALAGDVPMVPRWALGNWWSRYWRYSQSELRGLMEEFRDRGLPLSVCMIDMDWHVIDNEYHYGWTGWTWNEELFPDPPEFVDWLHESGLRTGVNLHPAQGVHPHEEQYEPFAEHMGIDPGTEAPVEFDAADTQFLSGYFEHVIRPMERRDGVDFWWIDWQQWDESPGLAGLDPLWALNHLHALDRTRDGRRPFILSRWPGIGGHRYPVQFSGDHYSLWESLQFQPYLTATSANVNCGWWSHDVGGHTGGTGDPIGFGELYARWTQFGVLSPVNRIHTTKDRFIDKRPWTFGADIAGAVGDALRFRHALVPYLYTMARRNHERGYPLIEPLYYDHPHEEAAYTCPTEYLFGTELVAAPHVEPRGDATNLSRRSVWLPDGDWFDFFTGEQYDGGWHARYGDLDDIPLYARAGAIVPMGPEVDWGGIDPPGTLRTVVFPGADNSFELYEDDGVSQAHRDGEFATTRITQEWDGDRMTVGIEPPEGATEHVPDDRDYRIEVRGVVEPETVRAERADVVDPVYDDGTSTLELAVAGDPADGPVSVVLETDGESLIDRRDRRAERAERMLETFAMPVAVKAPLRERVRSDPEDDGWLHEFAASLERPHARALAETLYGIGAERVTNEEFDRIVVWNESGRDDVRYRFSAWRPSRGDRSSGGERGAVRGYVVVDLDEWDADDWELELRCGDVVVASIEGGAD